MHRRPDPAVTAVGGAVLVVAYAWWATGTQPFTLAASLAVAAPVAVVGALTLPWPPSAPDPPAALNREAPPGASEERDRGGLRRAAPWITILLLSVSLEVAALALGGRSPTVPTLSTVVDHALGRHPVRLLLFCGWLAFGLVPAVRSVRSARVRPLFRRGSRAA